MIRILVLALLLATQAEPKPVPEAAAEQASLKTVRDVFKDEYAKKGPAERLALAKKMLQQAGETKDDAVSQYVLLKEARDLAVDAGSAETAMQAIDVLAREFKINRIAVRSAALAALEKTARTTDDLKPLAEARLRLADEALAMDDLDTAAAATTAASSHARKAKDLALVARSDARGKEVAARKKTFESVKKAQDTLSSKADDPAASAVVGKYLCFLKGDWENGLPLLAKSSDEAMKGAAEKDLAKPGAGPDQVALGDAWWQLGEKDKDAKEGARRRALHWYGQALPQLTGLPKSRVEKRLLDGRLELIAKGTWVDITDPKLFGQAGKPGDSIRLKPETGKFVFVEYPIAGDFDGLSIRVRFETPDKRKAQIRYTEGTQAHTTSLGASLIWTNSGPEGSNQTKTAFTAKITEKDERVVTIILSSGSFAVYLDGEEMGRHSASAGKLGKLKLALVDGPLSYDQIRLHRRE